MFMSYYTNKQYVTNVSSLNVYNRIGRASGSRYMTRIRATGADLGTGHNNNIRWMNFRLMNIRKIRIYISCVIPFLSKMSDLIWSLPHNHRQRFK